MSSELRKDADGIFWVEGPQERKAADLLHTAHLFCSHYCTIARTEAPTESGEANTLLRLFRMCVTGNYDIGVDLYLVMLDLYIEFRDDPKDALLSMASSTQFALEERAGFVQDIQDILNVAFHANLYRSAMRLWLDGGRERMSSYELAMWDLNKDYEKMCAERAAAYKEYERAPKAPPPPPPPCIT